MKRYSCNHTEALSLSEAKRGGYEYKEFLETLAEELVDKERCDEAIRCYTGVIVS